MDIAGQKKRYAALCEENLRILADRLFEADSRVSDAGRYSLLNAGKRVRGTLVLATCEMLDGSLEAAGVFAAALEMVHASSLIHDDLPCMDDDAIRRGKPSCHVAFGEDIAVLAGYMLLTQGFEALLAPGFALPAEMQVAAGRELAAAAGSRGMIYGQELDLRCEGKNISLKTLQTIHKYKTGAMIRAAVRLGAVTAGNDPGVIEQLNLFADKIGMVFQIVDDILDVTSTEKELGKPIGSDKAQGKNTYASLLGIEHSTMLGRQLTQEAIQLLQSVYGGKASFLCAYAQELATRLS